MQNITISELLRITESFEICSGVSEKAIDAKLINHVIHSVRFWYLASNVMNVLLLKKASLAKPKEK